jgi:hypothetical protein
VDGLRALRQPFEVGMWLLHCGKCGRAFDSDAIRCAACAATSLSLAPAAAANARRRIGWNVAGAVVALTVFWLAAFWSGFYLGTLFR